MYSDWSNVTSGVPQGSGLGPVLFVIFINDLPEILESWCTMYADDTKVSSTVQTESERQTMQADIDKLVALMQISARLYTLAGITQSKTIL